MIVTCPACATTSELPAEALADGHSIIRCGACGHGWIEARARDVHHGDELLAEALHEASGDKDALAAQALAAQALKKERQQQLRRARRRAEARRFGLLAAALGIMAALLWSFPEEVVRHAPGAARMYQALDMKVNPYGFDIRRVQTSQKLLTGGEVVLAISGEIANVARWRRKAPGLQFELVDEKGKKLHSWKLPPASDKSIESGKAATFITRLAAPPRDARRVIVRLAEQS